MYTYESFADLANKLQTKVSQMNQEMSDKADELESYKEEIITVQGTFEELENELGIGEATQPELPGMTPQNDTLNINGMTTDEDVKEFTESIEKIEDKLYE